MPQIDIIIFSYAVVSLLFFYAFSLISTYFSNQIAVCLKWFNHVSKYMKVFVDTLKNESKTGIFFSVGWVSNTFAPTGFQTPASMKMAAMICTHNDIYYFLSVILLIVSWLIVVSLYKNTKYISPFSEPEFEWWNNPKTAAEIFDSCTTLEILWTIIPTLVLLFIGYPNISLLYALDQIPKTWFNIKIIGHQWYWTYEYTTIEDCSSIPSKRVSYDSTLIENFDLFKRLEAANTKLPVWFEKEYYSDPELDFKYVMVDNPLVIPAHVNVQAIISSADVLHSWAVPALGVKMDACPGRLNRIIFKADIDSRIYQRKFKSKIVRYLTYGITPFFTGYWGQCSELCGIGHGFMPIIVHAIQIKEFSFVFNSIFPTNTNFFFKHSWMYRGLFMTNLAGSKNELHWVASGKYALDRIESKFIRIFPGRPVSSLSLRRGFRVQMWALHSCKTRWHAEYKTPLYHKRYPTSKLDINSNRLVWRIFFQSSYIGNRRVDYLESLKLKPNLHIQYKELDRFFLKLLNISDNWDYDRPLLADKSKSEYYY